MRATSTGSRSTTEQQRRLDISGYKIYDNGGQGGTKTKKAIPAGTILPAKGFYVVITDTNTSASIVDGFGLSSGGETVWFENATGTIIDSVVIPALGRRYELGTQTRRLHELREAVADDPRHQQRTARSS